MHSFTLTRNDVNCSSRLAMSQDTIVILNGLLSLKFIGKKLLKEERRICPKAYSVDGEWKCSNSGG